MIVDLLSRSNSYPYGEAWTKAFDFVKNLDPEIVDGKYKIEGDDIYAVVMSYLTKTPEEAKIETHRMYVDLQTVIRGVELCEWFPVEGLEIETPYDESKDAQFYLRPNKGPVSIDLYPGIFAVFSPHDAHMPSLTIGTTPGSIKKVVVKIRVDLLLPLRVRPRK